MCITDNDHRLKYVASTLAAMIGYTPDDLIGKKIFNLFPSRDSKNLSLQFKHISTDDRITFQIRLKHKSGKAVPVDFFRIPFPVNQSSHYLYLAPPASCSGTSENEPQPAEDGSVRYNESIQEPDFFQKQTDILSLMKELHANWTYPIKWSYILKKIKNIVYHDKAILLIYDQSTETFHCEASCGFSKKEIKKAENMAATGNPGKAIDNGEPFFEVNLIGNSSKNAAIDLAHTQSSLIAPLKIEDQKMGVLVFQSTQKPGYQQSDLDMISIFTTYLASLILNHRLIPKSYDLEKYKRLFSKANIPIFFCKKNGRVIECNQAFQELLGFPSKKQALKSNLYHYIHLYSNGKRTFQQLISKCGFLINLEVQLKNNNRKNHHALISIAPIHDEKAQIIGYEGTLQDISEKRRQKEELIQAQKLISLGSLAGGIIHDFNNLLGGIMGCASLIMGEMSKKNRYYQDVETIFNASRKATELTSDMLSFSRKDKPQIKVVSINDIVSEVIRILSRTIDKSIQIKLNLYPDVTPIEVDASRIQQTLMNICINARDAMPAGGDLIIETTNAIVDRPFDESNFKIDPGAYVVIKISDTGLGIDPKTMHKIFEPFFTTKTKKHGSGLGLAIANEIVKNHKGGIRVESVFGEGATFTIYLPASSADVEQSITIPSIVSLPKGSETILLVDDEELIRDMGKRMLEKFGYKVLVANDGMEALEIYQKEGKHIDALILDIIMPKMDGIKTFMEVKKLNPGAKVLLATGSILNGKEAKLRKQGVAGLLQKPFLASQILKTIRQTLD